MARDEAVTVRRAVERLAMRLLRFDFGGPQDLWDYQLELLSLQRRIQDLVTTEKVAAGKETDARERLKSLRRTRWHARRLGDAFAWVLLRNQKQVIAPLADNSKVPIPPETDGSRGVIAIASHLSGEYGFPLLHDATDCLRIGDITFVRPAQTDDFIRTVEVKTQLVERHPGRGVGAIETLNVQVIYPNNPPEGPPAEGSPPSRRHPDPRVARQIDRLVRAKALTSATDGSVVQFAGEPPHLTTVVADDTSSHWSVLRRVIRKARAHSYGSEVVDALSLYAAFYHPEGFSPEMLSQSTLADDVVSSGIFLPETPERNSIVITAIPEQEGQGAYRSLPFFLYPIPRRAVSDLLNQRLTIMVLTNPGRIAEALEGMGFSVSVKGSGNPMVGENLVATYSSVTPHGHAFTAELHGLAYQFQELVHEFRSLDYFLLHAQAMKDASARSAAESFDVRVD